MQVPIDPSGSLIRHPHRYPSPDDIVWEDAEPFEARLILADVRNAQGYGKYVIWQEAHGIRRFPMDTEHAFAVVKNMLIDHGAIITDTDPEWTFTKAHARGGDAYGIKLVRKRFLDQEDGDADLEENEE
ncbi:hypothetical protein [Nonomuraea basaltis]|uniref:hypothetical protein n=1 Tax=Nonomuraea basaltis TaxID=2495887 RepID=UPI00110C618A|nr:hypothetical protein [Nonomuraea basaltis]TMR99547.1 hypothetical protein EJK15_06970 [Nonomuraea basaltis]